MKSAEKKLTILQQVNKYILPVLFLFLAALISCNNDGFNRTIKFESIPTLALIPEPGHPVPGNNGIITATVISGGSIELAWERASDAGTASADLQYRVYRSGGDTINTAGEAEANGTVVAGWTADIGRIAVSGLAPGQVYYFNIVVKNSIGFLTAYLSVAVAMPNYPVPGNNGLISISSITGTGLALSWSPARDVETAAPDLEYRVYRSGSGNIADPDLADRNGVPMNEWTKNIAGIPVSGLVSGQVYYFNVVVRDADGNQSAYRAVSTAMPNYPVPGGNGLLSTGTITGTGLALSWAPASDTETAPADLEYRVFRSEKDNIATATGAEAYGVPLTAWVKDMTGAPVTGLNPGSVWYFNVLVKDGDGNESAYGAVSVATLNVPVPGNMGLITTGAVTTTGIQIFWTRATDVETSQSDIRYRVYQSDSGAIGNYDDAVAAASAGTASLIVNWSKNIATVNPTGLTPGKTYYFNVFAADADNNVSGYIMVSATTQSDAIYMFSAGRFGGNLTTPTTASPRADIDAYCTDAKAAQYPSLPCVNVRTFISISQTDAITYMPANYGVPTDKGIISPGGTLIAANWSDLLDGTINETLGAAGLGYGFWWSGSDANGNYNMTPSCTNCNTCGSWTDGTGKSVGECGAANKADVNWISNGGSNCNNPLMVLCLCW